MLSNLAHAAARPNRSDQRTSRRKPTLAAPAAVLAAALLLPTSAGAQEGRSPSPVNSSTTVYGGDETASSASGQHDGTWPYGGDLYGPGPTTRPGDQAFLFSEDNYFSHVVMDTAVAQFGRAAFAISFNLKKSEAGFQSVLGARAVCTHDSSGWFDFRAGDRLGVEVGGDRYTGVTSPVSIDDGAWHAVDFRRTDAGLSLTVDGVTTFAATPPSDVRPVAAFGLNASPCISRDGTEPLLGSIDDVHIGLLDVTAPTLRAPADQVRDATSVDGAVATYTATATDDLDPAPVVSCTPASGTTFPVGVTRVRCTAADATGNESTPQLFDVTVRSAAQQVDLLTATLRSVAEKGLVSKGEAAQESLARGNIDAARGQLGALRNSSAAAVKAGRLTQAQGEAIMADVTRILGALG